jgi:hypothetical protein
MRWWPGWGRTCAGEVERPVIAGSAAPGHPTRQSRRLRPVNQRVARRMMYLGLVFAVLGLLLGATNSVGGTDPVSLILAVGQVVCGLLLSVLGYLQSRRPDEPDGDSEPDQTE